MKFSEQWLREWISPALSTAELVEQLTMAGLEVDAVEPVGLSFAGVVAGEVLDVQSHPSVDSLRVCQVHVGDVEALTIVCDSPNAHVGLRVPLAMVGAMLPGGHLIKQVVVHGVKSDGMLCSASELGLGEDAGGLLELPPDTQTGEDIYTYMKLDDVSIELGLTPNRGDCASIAGIARELGVLNRLAVQTTPTTPVIGTIPDSLQVNVETPEACPHYVGRVLRGIDRQARTPLWMRERLRRSGMKSINAVVDVTNYIMLELGQPMHAFDLDKLKGAICVRHARPGETMTLLDGQSVKLAADTLVIADQRQAQAIAGIMGGLDAAIGDTTDALFLESAYFAPQPIAGRARCYGLHTESSYRFERGVDPTLQVWAMERTTALLLEIVGGEAGPITEVVADAQLVARPAIKLRARRIQRLLGIAIAQEQVTDILIRLGFNPIEEREGWRVTPPSYRFDIAIEADLVEEIGRIYGYNRLPVSRPYGALTIGESSEAKTSLQRLRELLVDRGYQEIVSYSFVDPRLQRLLDPERVPIALANPISSGMSVMRTSLWPGLIQTTIYNQNRQQTRLRFFESGLTFVRQAHEIIEENFIASIVTGDACPEQWAQHTRAADFYDVKSDVDALLGMTGEPRAFNFVAAEHRALHPGQTARIERNGRHVGWLGALHPALERELGLNGRAYAFELNLRTIEKARVPGFLELSRFPAIRRDIAVVVDEDVSSQAVRECISDLVAAYPHELQVFDVYQGKGIDFGKKSLAMGLILQEASRTLTDEEVDALIDKVVERLHNEFGAILRR